MEPQTNPFIKVVLFGIYFPLLTLISCLILYKLKLLISYILTRNKVPRPKARFDNLPFVTIQLPLFNEANVVERLLRSAVSLDYPKDRFEIQVLDDSTDHTLRISKGLVEKYRKAGFNIALHHRTDRRDYKAGALAEGVRRARGEFLAIFDSDFIIPKNFLADTIHYFTDPKTGMVQCRWGFINEDDSLLTRLQSTFLNGHFIIEHTARNRSGHFFNFNGTAGIWRKEAIETSGGWHGDTLTEDLDLSYRAQLNKWKFVYLKDLVAPSELPPTLDAFNSQQFRWVKGMCEVLVKLIPNILRSRIPVRNKLDAVFNLLSCVGYISSVLISFSSIPVLLLAKNYIDEKFMALAVTFIIINLFMIWLYYFYAELSVRGLKLQSFVYPALLVVFSIGFSLNGVYAIKQALLKKKTAFIRTPKFNNVIKKTIRSDNNSNPVYRAVAFFTLYFSVLTVYIVANEKFNILPALLFFAPSYFWLFGKIIREKFIFHTSKS